jgi:uncharacterized protein YegL
MSIEKINKLRTKIKNKIMPKQGLTEIVTIIDKSGSMSSLKSKTIEGFNEFLTEQKSIKGEANFSLVLFSSHGKEKIVFDSIDIQDTTNLTEENYQPNGTTALYDAIGKTIKAMKKRIKNLDDNERPDRVLFVILTDGQENDSKIFNKEKVFKLIKKMEKKNNWSFIYLGSNQDAFAEGSKMGVNTSKTLNYSADVNGMNFAYTNITNYTKQYRTADTSIQANNLSFDDINIDGNTN